MSGEIFNIVKELLAVALSGICIKMMDDFLDREIDKLQGKETLVQQLDSATLPYSLILIVIAMALDSTLAGSLFLASYIIGMGKESFSDSLRLLPSGLPNYLEMLMGLVIGIGLWGFSEMVSSLTIILTIQFFDDYYDYQFQKERSSSNWVQRTGKLETILLIIICFLVSLILNMQKLVLVLAVAPLIVCFLEKPTIGKEKEKMIAAWLILLGLTTFLMGYTIGKKCGTIRGLEEGLRLSPLQIRQVSLEKGQCQICGNLPQEIRSESKSVLLLKNTN